MHMPGQEGDAPQGDERAAVRRVRRYWDAHPISVDSVPHEPGTSDSFDAIYARWQRQMHPRRLAFLESCAGDRVLEIGCGIAIDGRFLASHGARYQAVDLSRASLALARRHFALNDLPPRFANADATGLPFIYKPERGFIASANNRPASERKYLYDGFFPQDERIRGLRQILETTDSHDLQSLTDLQMDTVSLLSRDLVEAVADRLRAWTPRNEGERTAIDMLLAWDGDYDRTRKEPVVFEAFATALPSAPPRGS